MLSRRMLLLSAAPLLAQMPARRTPSQPLRILANSTFTPEEKRRIESAAPGTKVELIVASSPSEFAAQLPTVEAVYGQLRGSDLEKAPNVKWLQSGGAGVEWMDARLRDSGVMVTNMARTFAPGISETAIGLLLGLTHRIGTDYREQFYQKQWKPIGTPRSADHIELAGKTMGIVGMGGIGSAIAKRAKYGFDMRIVATDAKPMAKPEFVDELHDPSWFPTMVPLVDVLVSAAPHTPQTDKMFNEQVFRSMKKTAYFLGMSRGNLFDDKALVKALQEGWIAGAGLDVFPVEPIPADHPIFQCKNVLITPHTSGWSMDRQERLIELFTDNVRRYAAGLPMRNVVDKQAGY